jgi:hypothetical protein
MKDTMQGIEKSTVSFFYVLRNKEKGNIGFT